MHANNYTLLQLHTGATPDQLRLGWHSLSTKSLKVYPILHAYVAAFVKVVPDDVITTPLAIEGGGPQSTAI